MALGLDRYLLHSGRSCLCLWPAQIEEVSAFSSSTNQVLDDLVKHFALEEALEVKKVRTCSVSWL